MAKVIKTVFQVRRDTEANWLAHSSIVPAAGEPCLTLDGKYAGQVKFGDGVKTWGELHYAGVAEFQGDGITVEITDGVVSLIGADSASAGQSFRIAADGTSIEWFDVASQEDVVSLREIMASTQGTITNLQEVVAGKANADDVYTKEEVDEIVKGAFHYRGTVGSLDEVVEPKQGDVYQLSSGGFKVYDGDSWEDFCVEIDLSDYATVERSDALYEKVKYEVTNTPAGTLVDYRDKEIRVMCPADAVFTKQSVGTNGNPNMYYMTFKAYAPEGAVSFQEDDKDGIEDQTMYYFENNSSAGIDKYGRKYSVCWLALASYDESTGIWSYFGKNSTFEKYIGWYYTVKWYGEDGKVIGSDKIRINLSNESCHDEIKPSYLSDIMKASVTGIRIAGNDVVIENNIAEIPVASDESFGVVKSSEGDNKVFVNEDGTMEIKSISWSILSQEEGETIYMDGGDASV